VKRGLALVAAGFVLSGACSWFTGDLPLWRSVGATLSAYYSIALYLRALDELESAASRSLHFQRVADPSHIATIFNNSWFLPSRFHGVIVPPRSIRGVGLDSSPSVVLLPAKLRLLRIEPLNRSSEV
jgi:hypothetical protein